MPPSTIPGNQTRHQLRAFEEISAQEDLNIHTLLELQAWFQCGLRENRPAHRPGDSFRLGPIINYGFCGAEIHVIADHGHGEAFLAKPGAGLTGQIFSPGAVPDLDGRVHQFGGGQGRWRR